MFGPMPHERSERVEDAKALLPKLDATLAEVTKRLEEFAPKRGSIKVIPFENGWMYFTQGSRGKTDYRIYLAPHLRFLPFVFYELARLVPAQIAYQMKTFAAGGLRAEDMMRGDKVIVYASEESFAALLEIVEKITQEHPEIFAGKNPPGGGIYSPREGISIALQAPKSPGKEATGTQIMTDAIKVSLDT